MRNSIFKYFCIILAALPLLTGCYREDIAEIHDTVDTFDLRSKEDRVKQLEASLAEMLDLREQLPPLISELQSATVTLAAEIEDIRNRMAQDGEPVAELQAQLLSFQTEYKVLTSVYQALLDLDLTGRAEEISRLIKEFESGTASRISDLEFAFAQFAEADSLAKLEAEVNQLPSDFQVNFDSALAKYKELILSWISESDEFIALFEDYYTAAGTDALLDVIDSVDVAQDSELKALRKEADRVKSDIRSLVGDAVNGLTSRIEEKHGAIRTRLDKLTETVDGLEKRIEALEKVFSVVGDYSYFEGTIIDAIKALQAFADSNEGEHTGFTEMLNTLKLQLVNGKSNYYDFESFLDQIYTNYTDIDAIEDLVSVLPSVASLGAIREELDRLTSLVGELESGIGGNIDKTQTLIQTVSGMVTNWTKALLSQITTNADDIIKLLEADERLWAAINEGAGIDKERHDSVMNVISGISETITGLVALSDTVYNVSALIGKINGVLDSCGIDGVKGIEDCLTNLDKRVVTLLSDVDALWGIIGTWDIELGADITSAIDAIQAKFGNLDGKTVEAIVSALGNDRDILRSRIGDIIAGSEGVSITSLKDALDGIRDALSGRADKAALQVVSEKVGELQNGLLSIVETLDGKIKDYILTAEADTVYANLKLLGDLIDSYTTFYSEYKSRIGTVTGDIAALYVKMKSDSTGYDSRIGSIDGDIVTINSTIDGINGKIGGINGNIGRISGNIGTGTLAWVENDLVSALNTLYAISATRTDSAKAAGIATSIAQKILDDFIKTILGEDGDASAVKSLLDSFANGISSLVTRVGTLEASVGDLSWFTGSDLFKNGDNKDISTAIKNIKTILDDCSRDGHKHDYLKDISDLSDLTSRFTTALGSISEGNFTNFVDAINYILGKFNGYTTKDAIDSIVNPLLATAEAILATAVLEGDTDGPFKAYFSSLNLNSINGLIKELADDLVDIIKDGGTIDTHTQSLIDAAVTALNLEQYFKVADLDTLSKYVTKESSAQTISYLTSLGALEIVLDNEHKYNYGSFNDAINFILDSLGNHITDFSALKSNFETLENRIKDLENIIGDGIQGKTLTAAINEIVGTLTGFQTSIQGIGTLLGDIDEGESVAGLLESLKGTYDALLAALLGGAEEITAEMSLSALKQRLDDIGFSTIKNANNSTLQEVLDNINTSIGTLYGLIGDLGTRTVVDSLTVLNEALEGFARITGFQQDSTSLQARVQALIDALAGKTNGTATEICNLTDVKTAFDAIFARMEDFKNVQGNGSLEDTLVRIGQNLSSWLSYSDTTGIFDATLVERIQDLQSAIKNLNVLDEQSTGKIIDELGDVSIEIARAKIKIGVYPTTGIEGLLTFIQGIDRGVNYIIEMLKYLGFEISYDDWYRQRMGELKTEMAVYATRPADMSVLNTTSRESIVGAINELFEILSDVNGYAASSDLEKWKTEITGGSTETLSSIDALIKALQGKVEGYNSSNTVYAALESLENLRKTIKNALGTNDTGYSDVWSAIEALKTQLLGSIGSRINSLVFIPDYDDGKATLGVKNAEHTAFDTLVLKFKVNATPDFAERFGTNARDVKGYVKTKTNTGKGTAINGKGVLSDGIITVKYPGTEFGGKVQYDQPAMVASVITDGSSEEFTSNYIPVCCVELRRIKSADPGDNSAIKVAQGVPSKATIALTPYDSSDELKDLSVTNNNPSRITSVSTGKSTTVEVSNSIGTSDRNLSFSISDGFTTVSYSLNVINLSTNFTCGLSQGATHQNNTSTVTYSSSRNTKTITFDQEAIKNIKNTGVNITSSASNKNVVTSCSMSENTLSFSFSSSVQNGNSSIITISAGNNSIAVITVTYSSGRP